jgi:NAD(P)-dependent dehydrogenase (short-subunit alcohol dehydrogenase family)
MTDKPLANRLALVTGASRGIGRATALALSDLGAHVIACARRRSGLEDLDDEIHARGGTATLIQFDLKDRERINVLGPTLFQRWGKLDISDSQRRVCSAPLSPLHHITADAWTTVICTSTSTPTGCCIRTLDPLLRRSEAGRVVFVSSGAAQAKYAYWGPYSVSKAGLEALAKTYAHGSRKQPGPRQHRQPGADCARRCARRHSLEKIQIRCPSPNAIAPLFVDLCLASTIAQRRRDPAFQETGQRFDFADFK